MHEVVPRVVAIAVRMVMAICMIFWMISFLFMAFGVMSFEFFSPPSQGGFRAFVILKGAKRSEDELLRTLSEKSECISTSPLERGRGVLVYIRLVCLTHPQPPLKRGD